MAAADRPPGHHPCEADPDGREVPAGPNRPPEAFSHLVDHQYQIALGRIARVLFCVEQGRMVLLHGFVKKTRKTPQRDIDLALKRKKGASA